MIRTHVRLSEAEHEAAKREAAQLGISLAELRRLIPSDESKAWMRFAGMVESGDPDSSTRIDEVVYAGRR